MYCWPCLFRWLNTNHTTCPVCKAGVTQENVIPIFLSSSSNTSNVRSSSHSLSNNSEESKFSNVENIPNRPQAHRPEPLPALHPQTGPYNQQAGGILFSAGYGYFPSLFGLQFQSFTPSVPLSTNNNTNNANEEIQKVFLSRVLLGLGVAVILCLLFF